MPVIVFVRYGARISVEIYILSFGGFNVFQNFGQARFAGCCHGIDGREMMDSVKLNDVSRHLFLVTRRSTF